MDTIVFLYLKVQDRHIGGGENVVFHLDKEGSLQCLSQVIVTAE